jgi:uncharacterized small protein (DUF1192 family)
MSETRESELRELIAKAKGLPWSASRDGTIGPLGYGVATIVAACPEDARADMAALIVAAVNALPGLLDEIAALRARVEKAKAERDVWKAATEEAREPLFALQRALLLNPSLTGIRPDAAIKAARRAVLLSRIEKEGE